jgi:O-antigen/teichoic acid export membrane protein
LFGYAFLIALILPLESFIGAAIVQTQKDLHFKDFAKIELYESLSLYIIQISLAFLNFGVWAFFIAILSSRIIKTLLCLKILKYNIVPKFNFSIFKGKYLNGFYFQLNSILPTSKAMILPLILSLFLDIHSIGIIFWVSSLVSVPLVLVYNYNSVLFPALSKFQDNHTSAKELAGQSMEKMILILVFVFGLGGIVGDQIIALAFNENWADAKNVIFVCALYHLVYAMRTMCYPILYAKNLASKRTIAELLLVILEYAAVYFFCKDFGTKGYFVSLIFINILAFYFLYYHSRDWLLRSTFWRFHLSIVGVLIIYGLERWFNFPTKNINSLMIEAISFSVFLFIFFYLLDLKFRMLFLEIIHKVKKNASKI